MAAVIIRKKDVERRGRKLMKEVYKFLHDEYILSFDEMKVEKDKLEKFIVKCNFERYNFTNTQKGNEWTFEHGKYDESKREEDLKEIEERIEDESLDINLIFRVLNDLNLCMEIDEDLYFKKKAFIHIFKVFDMDYTYLED